MILAAFEKMLSWPPPAWVRKVEVAVIMGVFADAFAVDPPAVANRSADEALAAFREFTAACMEAFHLFQRGREDVHPITGLYLMEVQSSTDWALNPSESRFEPNTYFEVSYESVIKKIEALNVYENVIRPVPHPRSVEALMALPRLRGAQAGYEYAEAFQCVFRRGL